MSLAVGWFALLLYLGGLVEGYKDYKDYKIYDVMARSEIEHNFLRELSKDRAYEFLKFGRSFNTSNRVLVSPNYTNAIEEILNDNGIYYTTLVDDLSIVLQEQREENARWNRDSGFNVSEKFYQHDEINDYLDLLAKTYPSRVFVKIFGRSYERRLLKTITITNGDGRTGKKVIFIDAAVHAREWITPSMALYIIQELVENYDNYKELLVNHDWVLLPVVNADGYEYTHTEDRYWRKSRTPNLDSDCVGTDINRNFGFQWGLEEGASLDPCEEIYAGSKAFSEPETRVVRDIMLNYKDRLVFYLSLHSYGNYMLLPWGYQSDLPDNFFDLMDVAQKGALAMLTDSGSTYTYGSAYGVMYMTSGDACDYAAGAVQIPVTIAMELPAGGFSGFDPPVRQIGLFVTETWVGIKEMAAYVIETY